MPPTSRTLTVDAVPRDEAVAAGRQTTVDVTVTDADGSPVAGADVAVVVVDEAVLSLIGYELADPIATFYGALPSYLASEYLRRTVLLARADALTHARARRWTTAAGGTAEEAAATEATPAAAGGATAATEVRPAAPSRGRRRPRRTGADGAPIDVRSDFDALAVFAPVGDHRRRGPGHRRRHPARQPHPLPGPGRGRSRWRPVRYGRVRRSPPACRCRSGRPPPLRQLRRRVRAAASWCRTRPTADLVVDVVLETANLDAATGPAQAGAR